MSPKFRFTIVSRLQCYIYSVNFPNLSRFSVLIQTQHTSPTTSLPVCRRKEKESVTLEMGEEFREVGVGGNVHLLAQAVARRLDAAHFAERDDGYFFGGQSQAQKRTKP